MSRIIASAAIRGAHNIAKQAQEILADAIEQKGKDCKVEFPNTGYYIPIIYSMTGKAVETLADFEEVMDEIKGLLPPLVKKTTHFRQPAPGLVPRRPRGARGRPGRRPSSPANGQRPSLHHP